MNDKKVFPYFNGVERVFADPFAVYRRLTERLRADPNEVLRDCHSADVPTKTEAQARYVEAIRYAFPMQAFDERTGEGATEADCWSALDAYLDWTDSKKETAAS